MLLEVEKEAGGDPSKERNRWELEARKASASSSRALILQDESRRWNFKFSSVAVFQSDVGSTMKDERRIRRTTISKALSFILSIPCSLQPALILFESSIQVSRTLQTRFFSESESFSSLRPCKADFSISFLLSCDLFSLQRISLFRPFVQLYLKLNVLLPAMEKQRPRPKLKSKSKSTLLCKLLFLELKLAS